MADVLSPPTGSKALKNLFSFYDALSSGYISTLQVQRLHQEIRVGGISIPQVLASLQYKNVDKHRIYLSDLPRILQEMDRRYFLVQDLQWEFALLDHNHRGVIPVKQARFLMEARHGHTFSKHVWNRFLSSRPVPNSPLSFAEMEVELCNVMEKDQVEYEIPVQEIIKPERPVKKREEKPKPVIKQTQVDESRKLKEENERRQQMEELEAKKREAEEKRRLEEEEQKTNREKAEAEDREAKEEEEMAKQQERMLLDAAKKESNKEKKKQADKEAKIAAKKAEHAKRKRIRASLKVAVERVDRQLLIKATKDFKDEKLSDDNGDLQKAERLLTMFKCSDAMKDGISKRLIEQLETSLDTAKKNGFHHNELVDLSAQAEELLIRLRRLERLRHEVLELKSSTIAEIRSYKQPPPEVHNVMIATYLILGTPEKQTKKWSNVQTLLGKTGREGLKRRIMQLKVTDVNFATATKAKVEMGEIDLESIRDVSAGAATFYVWADGMIEETLSV